VHGEAGLVAAKRISAALFSGNLQELSAGDLQQLKLDGLPSASLPRPALVGLPLTQLLADCGLAASGKQVKDALAAQAVLLNGCVLGIDDNMNLPDCFAAERALHGRFYIVRLGKKKYHLFEVV
jgi:tyrosyl-tRNA synthetase